MQKHFFCPLFSYLGRKYDLQAAKIWEITEQKKVRFLSLTKSCGLDMWLLTHLFPYFYKMFLL